jgi:basic membrane protein A
MNLLKLSLVASLFAVMIGCNSSSSTTTTPTEASAKPAASSETALKVGIVFDSGGRGDKSFNDSAYAGIERAVKELGIEEANIQSKSPAEYEANLQALAQKKVDIVFAVGLGMQQALAKVAPKFPDTKFAIVDGDSSGENTRSLKFKEEQGSFLAGYLAGLMSKTGKIGFVGGMAGAKMANPAIVLLPSKYTGSWDNPDKGKAAAAVLYSSGADIVYHAAGRAGLGIFAAAKEANKYVIGVDSNQDDIEKGTVLTSMIKRVDEAVFQTIKDLKDGKFTPGEKMYDAASGGVGLTEFANTRDIIGEANIAKLKEIQAKLASGEIVAPANAEEFAKMAK